jgi:hypothetical protein
MRLIEAQDGCDFCLPVLTQKNKQRHRHPDFLWIIVAQRRSSTSFANLTTKLSASLKPMRDRRSSHAAKRP